MPSLLRKQPNDVNYLVMMKKIPEIPILFALEVLLLAYK